MYIIIIHTAGIVFYTFRCVYFPCIICRVPFGFRLVAEKMNKNERKSTAEILNALQGKEPDEFWQTMGENPKMDIVVSILVKLLYRL